MLSRQASAQALVWFTLALPMFMSVAGLAIDGGWLLASRRQLQSVADGAARAGATRLDTALVRGSGGSSVQLDPGPAQDAVYGYLNEALVVSSAWQGPPDVQVDVGAQRVHVRISVRIKTAFLRIAHIDGVPVEASAFADVRYGIHDDGGG
jgi:Putative Flp pilus-assembly TadE/G-like